MESADIRVAALIADIFAVAHIADHGVFPEDINEVLEYAPQYFDNPPSPDRTATHLILGPNRQGRFLLIAISPAEEMGIWKAHTAHWFHARLALRFYKR